MLSSRYSGSDGFFVAFEVRPSFNDTSSFGGTVLRIPLLSSVVLCALLATAAGADEPTVDLTWGIKIPVRDGRSLNATLYRPAGNAAKVPAVVTMTPYIADAYHARGTYFAKHGYAFAAVDVRGRGNSEGVFEPFVHDARDGHDVVEWLARQPWCTGQVATWGGSYGGFNQWAVLKESPPHLATAVPAAAAHPGIDFPLQQNIFGTYDVRWLTLVAGRTPNEKLFGDEKHWIDQYRKYYLGHRPFTEMDTLAGVPSPHFQKWLQHPTPDDFWDSLVPSAEQYAKLELPLLTITGHYDDDQLGALTYYERHMKHGSAAGRAKHYLLMGPWDHAGTRTPAREVAGLTFGPNSLMDLNALHKDWYDHVMKSGPRPKALEKRVVYYVAGADVWKSADNLADIGKTKRVFYLDSTGQANDAFHSGRLQPDAPGKALPDRYVYDPLDVRPTELEREPVKNGLTDQRSALNRYGNGLVYHSDPFPKPTDISGRLKLTLWLALDVPDTDFEVDVYEILQDGTSILLANDTKRARYRESLREAKLVPAGKVLKYEFNTFNWFSRRIAAGSRLRLVVCSPNSVFMQKNYNGGGDVSRETAKDARTAHVLLHHDAEHPSGLELPIEE
jgi:putative CocE/NonD family hydrolase